MIENRYKYLPEAFLQTEGDSEIKKIAAAIQEVFQRVEDDLKPLWDQRNAKKCELSALAALSWELQTGRFPDETESSWRSRVFSAIEERVNAGSPRGFKRILEIFGVNNPTIIERYDPVNWDLVKINLDPITTTFTPEVFDKIFHRWGRTCRRHVTNYEFTNTQGVIVRPGFITCATTVFPTAV